jgi:hypothetical protein
MLSLRRVACPKAAPLMGWVWRTYPPQPVAARALDG